MSPGEQPHYPVLLVNSISAQGAAINTETTGDLMITNTTFKNNRLKDGGNQTIFNGAKITWGCQLGYFQRKKGNFGETAETADFDTCSFSPCPAGFLCNIPNISQVGPNQLCPPGEYCPQPATSVATPCPAGRSFPGRGSDNPDLCGLCAPGQYQPANGSTACSVCTAGTYSEAYGSQACTPCPFGGYCPRAGPGSYALAFKPCPAGRFNSNTGSNQ
jgi:hypothetical protein